MEKKNGISLILVQTDKVKALLAQASLNLRTVNYEKDVNFRIGHRRPSR